MATKMETDAAVRVIVSQQAQATSKQNWNFS